MAKAMVNEGILYGFETMRSKESNASVTTVLLTHKTHAEKQIFFPTPPEGQAFDSMEIWNQTTLLAVYTRIYRIVFIAFS